MKSLLNNLARNIRMQLLPWTRDWLPGTKGDYLQVNGITSDGRLFPIVLLPAGETLLRSGKMVRLWDHLSKQMRDGRDLSEPYLIQDMTMMCRTRGLKTYFGPFILRKGVTLTGTLRPEHSIVVGIGDNGDIY